MNGAPARLRPAPTKWRPTLGLVVLGVLATVMALPLVGLFFFRVYENGLVRQTEGELVAQSAVLAALLAREAEAVPGLRLGAALAEPPDPAEPYHPIDPALDLAGEDVLGRRPDARPSPAPPDPAYAAIGERLGPVLERAQRVTLAGYRLLDPAGTVIAGRAELGLSLAHVEEVAAALQGRARAVLRTRVSAHPPPPVYSLSRGTGVRVFTALPVVVGDRVAGVVYASRTPSNVVRHLYGERRRLLLAGAAVLAATLAAALLLSRAITGPIHALVARAHEIGQGRRPEPGRGRRPEPGVVRHGTREIALLSRSFEDMARRLHERSDYIATFAAHVSHELKAPLTSIQGAAELLRDADGEAMSPETRRRFLDNIVADTGRLAALLHRLRELARADNPETGGSTPLRPLLPPLRAAHPGLAIGAEGALDRPVAMSAENLGIVLQHLADNAARHGAAALRVAAEVEGECLRVAIEDDGEGISAGNRERVFDPFFTTRRESGGTGMGLGIVRALLHAHGGAIRLAASERGARFELRLPTSPAQ